MRIVNGVSALGERRRLAHRSQAILRLLLLSVMMDIPRIFQTPARRGERVAILRTNAACFQLPFPALPQPLAFLFRCCLLARTTVVWR